MEKKKKYNFGTLYKPKIMSQSTIDDGLKKAFGSMKGKEQGSISMQPVKPLNISGQQRKPEKSMFNPQPKEPEEDEPYWSVEQWEEWAYNLYKNYAETHDFLPDWFLEAMEEE